MGYIIQVEHLAISRCNYYVLLSERKVSWFTGIHPKPMMHGFCFICIESADIAQNICEENFHDSSVIHKNHEDFLLHSFCCWCYH